jgi:type VI secretion system protein ImpL
MLRSSGKSLDDGVPGFYTIEGFHTVLLPAADSAASRVASESWVLGQKIELDAGGTQLRALRREMIALYEADYARTWDGMLADLNIRPMKSLPRAAQDLYILASPQSPMRFLLASIARQLRLSVPPSPAAAAALPDADPEAERLRVLLGGGGPASATAPGQEIDERYKALLALFGDGASAPIDLVLKSLIDIQQSIAKQAAAPPGSAAPSFQPGNDPAQLLLATAARQPAPLSRWLTTIANSAISLRGGN